MWQHSRVNPLAKKNAQLKKARKTKRLQEAKKQAEIAHEARLHEIRD
jgi:hypothetical protein